MGTEIEIIKYLAPLGVGGILAYLMFLHYRKDSAKWGEDHKERAEIMTQLVEKTAVAVTNNTAAVNHLTDFIKNGQGRKSA